MVNVQHLRLINGEEIVGDVIEKTDNLVMIHNPMLIEEKKDELGSILILTKYIPFNKSKQCEVLRTHIITFTDLHPELVKYYYNSIEMNISVEERMIDEIKRVNTMMERVLEEQSHSDPKVPLDMRMVHKSTDTKH